MCKVSDKIKFCTCVDDDIEIEELNHYWVLHKFNKDKNMHVMGLPILPDTLDPLYGINEALVLKTLNTPDAFDKPVHLERGNRLEVILCNNEKNTLYFNFSYTGTKWKSIETDVFELMSKFDDIQQGEIKEIE